MQSVLIYLIDVNGSWVDDFGFVAGVTAWMTARRWQCYADAQLAIDEPEWHNDPDTIRRHGKVVKLRVTAVIEPFKGR